MSQRDEWDVLVPSRAGRLALPALVLCCVCRYCRAPAPAPAPAPCGPAPRELLAPPGLLGPGRGAWGWQAGACAGPACVRGDTAVTGLCAAARLVCRAEGLLGFRDGCLQAPNETSVWTKFCEVDVIRSVEGILDGKHDDEFPVNLARFENHLKKPVKIHNVYKVARNVNTKKKPKEDNITSDNLVNNSETNIKINDSRTCKSRKWKSSKETKLIDSSTPIEELDVEHKYAEGPFLTLADLVLYPCYSIIADYYGRPVLKEKLPFTMNWLESLEEIEGILAIKESIQDLLSLNGINRTSSNSISLPPIMDVSLYKCDPKRHNPKKRLFTKEDNIEQALDVLTIGMELSVQEDKAEQEIDWANIPPGANPKAGHLPDKRMDRKAQQLENLALAVLKVAKKGDRIVDFCSGSGHLGILVAHLLPECTVILLENKEQSLLRARERVHEMGLKNVFFFQCNLDFFVAEFDIGMALHACGIASDLVLDKCLKAKAKFVICPCCYGSLHVTDRLNYPRSKCFSRVPVEMYMCVGHAADQTHTDHPLSMRGARCMAVIDSDRGRLAEEFGYKVSLSRLKPLSCTPKNNLLIGVPL